MPKNHQVAQRAIELGLSKLKISAFKQAALGFRSAMQIDPHIIGACDRLLRENRQF